MLWSEQYWVAGGRMALCLKDIKIVKLKLSRSGQELNPGSEEVEEKPENLNCISRWSHVKYPALYRGLYFQWKKGC